MTYYGVGSSRKWNLPETCLSDHVAPRMDPSSPSESSAAHAARAKASRAFAIRAALVGGLSGLLYGYDIGSIGEALPELKEEFGLRTSQEEMVVSVMLAGAVIGQSLVLEF